MLTYYMSKYLLKAVGGKNATTIVVEGLEDEHIKEAAEATKGFSGELLAAVEDSCGITSQHSAQRRVVTCQFKASSRRVVCEFSESESAEALHVGRYPKSPNWRTATNIRGPTPALRT